MENFCRKTALVLCVSAALNTSSYAALQSLDDEEMQSISGQMGLLDIQRQNFVTNGVTNNSYRVGLNATVQTSVNIDRLRLGGDGNGDGITDIDISNFSLNGGDANGVSSATLRNPFIEFAFAGDLANDDISAREFIGVRFGAEEITGALSFGNREAVPELGLAANQGIRSIRGYLATQPITGTATTAAVTNRGDFNLQGNSIIAGILTAQFNSSNGRFTFDPVTANFTAPPIVINGPTATTSVTINTNPIPFPDVNFSVSLDAAVPPGSLSLGFIPIPFPTINLSIQDATGTISGLTGNGIVTQDLRFIHRTPVTNNGFYISFQNRPVDWLGSPDADVSQPGWWLSVENPVDLGPLNVTNVPLADSTLQEIADRASDFLLANPTAIGLGDALGGLVGAPITGLDLGTLALSGANPVNVPISNQDLGAGQNEIRNCWNGQLGC